VQATPTLRESLNRGTLLSIPGVFDMISARIADSLGFDVLYMTGYGTVASYLGVPDAGFATYTDMVSCVSRIASGTRARLIADGDTGYGGALNVMHTIRGYERAGAAAIQIEDQEFPKRCGHMDDKSLVDAEEMCRKVHIARQTLSDPDALVIARTDAIAVEGFEAALSRAERYLKAGADMIFVEAPETLEQIRAIAERLPGLKLINMFYGGKTPLTPLADLAAMGYRLAIIPSDLQRAAIHAMQATLAAIKQTGDSSALADQLTSFKEREEIVQTRRYLALDTQ